MALLIKDMLNGVTQGIALCRSAQQTPAADSCIRPSLAEAVWLS